MTRRSLAPNDFSLENAVTIMGNFHPYLFTVFMLIIVIVKIDRVKQIC